MDGPALQFAWDGLGGATQTTCVSPFGEQHADLNPLQNMGSVFSLRCTWAFVKCPMRPNVEEICICISIRIWILEDTPLSHLLVREIPIDL